MYVYFLNVEVEFLTCQFKLSQQKSIVDHMNTENLKTSCFCKLEFGCGTSCHTLITSVSFVCYYSDKMNEKPRMD